MTERETSKCIPVYRSNVEFQGPVELKLYEKLLEQYFLLHGVKNERQVPMDTIVSNWV